MREILFRGKEKKLDGSVGGWVFGGIHLRNNSSGDGKTLIIQNGFGEYGDRSYILYREVVPSTVGQYTGVKDSAGVQIFEGDILEITYDDVLHSHLKHYRAVEWKGAVGYPAFDFRGSTKWLHGANDITWSSAVYGARFRVAGNIHDNPELLKGDEA